jgi:hypothetical protein
MALATLRTLVGRVRSSLRLSAIVTLTDLSGNPAARVREHNVADTLETIADADCPRDRITIDTADGRTLVISATEEFAAVDVTDETRTRSRG